MLSDLFLTFNSFYRQDLEARSKVLTICAAPLEDDLSPLPLPLSIERTRRLGGAVARMQGGELLYVLGAMGLALWR